ncbi:hypothetical protein MVG78_15965 [Roseomonas gilardii subsp. gilardii]|uniref:hypothetical protein n=1 Tax=Roseomonas gilardii TaxID=257708 RepID=UPI001FFB7960|nr:hypothetical protein [Roseomonas gilardii]UPG72009.1 hypothetical protein MVG78_15965 [Roseomonas gilardii subsp. gilardii]
MGGLFSVPKPVVVTTPALPQQAMADSSAAVAGASAVQARQDDAERHRRGLAGTIATSERGVLSPLPVAARKTLLGE